MFGLLNPHPKRKVPEWQRATNSMVSRTTRASASIALETSGRSVADHRYTPHIREMRRGEGALVPGLLGDQEANNAIGKGQARASQPQKRLL